MPNPGESTLEHLIESTILTHESTGAEFYSVDGHECACGWVADWSADPSAWQQYAAHLREQITTTIRTHRRTP